MVFLGYALRIMNGLSCADGSWSASRKRTAGVMHEDIVQRRALNRQAIAP